MFCFLRVSPGGGTRAQTCTPVLSAQHLIPSDLRMLRYLFLSLRKILAQDIGESKVWLLTKKHLTVLASLIPHEGKPKGLPHPLCTSAKPSGPLKKKTQYSQAQEGTPHAPGSHSEVAVERGDVDLCLSANLKKKSRN